MKKSILLILVFTMLTAFTWHKEVTWMAIGDSITYLNGRPELTKKSHFERLYG